MARDEKKVTAVEVLRDVVKTKPNGEVRVQQEEMVKAIEESLNKNEHIIVEAPTGSGKAIGNLIPIIVSQKRAVISTATKQLSEQILDKELPFVQKALLETHPAYTVDSFTILKGRENYLCKKKEDEQAEFSSRATREAGNQLDLGDDKPVTKSNISGNARVFVEESALLDKWSEKTITGDRSEAPAVSEETWKAYSSTSVECPGKNNCRFGKECFAEKARDDASSAQIVVTNHAVVAHALVGENNFLDDREVVVFDEIHELSSYLTSSWGATVTIKKMADTLKEIKKSKEIKDNVLQKADHSLLTLERFFATATNGLVENRPKELKQALEDIQTSFLVIASTIEKKIRNSDISSDKKKEEMGMLVKRINEISDQLALVNREDEETVVWFTVPEISAYQKKAAANSKKVADPTVYLNAAPLRIGPKLQERLEEKELLMVGTSATIRVGGSFEVPIHNLGLDKQPHTAIDLDTPFDFAKQGMLYIPGSNFPSPQGQERKEHTEAAKQEALDLILAAGGRALVLTTTTYDCDEMAKFLSTSLKKKKIKVLRQGDAPQKQLVESFTEDETSVLVATIGMWHGLDVQGPSLSLVVITKIPFKPFDDPLLKARQNYAENNGRSGFKDVYIAEANVTLSQGVGRLIRHTQDKGVCAILDNRLLFKPYGKTMLQSLPEMKIFSNKTIVINALGRLTGTK